MTIQFSVSCPHNDPQATYIQKYSDSALACNMFVAHAANHGNEYAAFESLHQSDRSGIPHHSTHRAVRNFVLTDNEYNTLSDFEKFLADNLNGKTYGSIHDKPWVVVSRDSCYNVSLVEYDTNENFRRECSMTGIKTREHYMAVLVAYNEDAKPMRWHTQNLQSMPCHRTAMEYIHVLASFLTTKFPVAEVVHYTLHGERPVFKFNTEETLAH